MNVWLALLTSNRREYSGSDSPIALVFTPCMGEDVRRDLLQLTFSRASTRQHYLHRGEANLFHHEEGDERLLRYRPASLNTHLIIRGDDLWQPSRALVWADDGRSIRVFAFDPDLEAEDITLSADPSEGDVALRLSSTNLIPYDESLGSIHHLILVMETADRRWAGTDSPVRVTVDTASGRAFDYTIPDTPQWEQERAQANFYYVTVTTPFAWEDVTRVRLGIRGDDMWRPSRFFVFGEAGPEDHRAIVPLAYVPSWADAGLPTLSTDPSEGEPGVDLPLVEAPRPVPA